jgi:hypothetical protein
MNIDKSWVHSKNKTLQRQSRQQEPTSAWTTIIVSMPATADMLPTAGMPATERKFNNSRDANKNRKLGTLEWQGQYGR